MQAGLLRENIEIFRNAPTRNDYNEVTNNWASVKSCRAQVITQNMKRTMQNGEVWYPRAVVFKVRQGQGILKTDRVKWNAEMYSIISVINNRQDMSDTINAELINE